MEPTNQSVFGNRHSAFTLIELLVVVAIIALLAALLLPALQRAKESGRRSKCMGNLRQVAVATQLYIDDNQGRFPYYSWTYALLMPYLGNPSLSGTSHILYCPSALGKPEAVGDTLEAYMGGAYTWLSGKQCYGFNSRLQNLLVDTPITKLTDVKSSLSTVFWAADAGMYRYDDVYLGWLAGYRHGGRWDGISNLQVKPGAVGFNASFLDGHAEWVPWEKFNRWFWNPPYYIVNSGNPYAFW